MWLSTQPLYLCLIKMGSYKKNSCLMVASLDQCAPPVARFWLPCSQTSCRATLGLGHVEACRQGHRHWMEWRAVRGKREVACGWFFPSGISRIVLAREAVRLKVEVWTTQQAHQCVSALAKCEHTKMVFQEERTWNTVATGKMRILHFTMFTSSVVLMQFGVT